MPQSETTYLSPSDEKKFQEWAAINKIVDVDHPDSHYDYRGYYKDTNGAQHNPSEHFPDTYKQHGHPTFSVESKYSKGSNDGGSWNGDEFVPSKKQSLMPQFPFRNPVNYEDSPEWQPPDYAKPVESSEEWKPPSYAKEVEASDEWKPPEYAVAAKEDEKPKKSLFSKISDTAGKFADDIGKSVEYTANEGSKFLDAHPKTKEFAQRFLTGTSPKTEELFKKEGVTDVKGPGLTKVPGAEGAAEYVRKVGRNTGNYLGGALNGVAYWGGAAGSVAGDLIDLFGVADPRASALGKAAFGDHELPVRQSKEIPYRMEDINNYRTKKAIKEESIKQPIKPNFVNPFEKPPEAAKIPDDKPLPVRSPNLDRERFPEGIVEPEKALTAPITEDKIYDLARNKFNMGKDIPTEEGDIFKSTAKDTKWTPPDYATATKDTEEVKPTEEFGQGFGGAGHPESPDYVPKVLKFVDEKGKPGLSVEEGRKSSLPEYTLPGMKHVVYRDKDGYAVTVARIVKNSDGKVMVSDLATDKSKGLLSGRAVKRVADKLKELGATETSNTLSPDAENLITRLKRRGDWTPPDYAKAPEEPQAARTEGGKLAIGADIKSLGKVLGTSLYKGDIAPIATKELLQNSVDAVRHLGSEGKIDVIFDRHKGTIHVIDNGKGLTKQELESVFTDLGASGKRDDASAAGGFGLAKAAPLLGGEKVEVSSTTKDANGIFHKHSFSGTPNELLEGVDIKHEIVEPKIGSKINPVSEEPQTGTSVKVYVPKNSEFYHARNFVKNMKEHSPNIESRVRMADRSSVASSPMPREDEYINLRGSKGKSIATLDNPAAQTELIEPPNSVRRTGSSIDLHLSNNGMYQGTKPIYFLSEAPNLPTDLTVDIRSKVPEGHSDYPFTANREELRGTVEKQVRDYIDENIIKPGVGKRMDELKRLYNSMQEINVGKGEYPNTFGHKIAIYDPKGQITPSEMKQITSNSAFQTLAGNIAGTLKEAMKVAGNNEWRGRLEKIGIIFDDKLHGIHIPNPDSGKSAILVNPFIAIDKMSPDEASANILHTILHEMAHVEPERAGHNESFTIRLGDIYGKFGARRSVEAQDQILNSIANPNTGVYHPEIQELLQTYKESRGREATTEDLLSGTGIGSKSKGGGEGDIPSDDQSVGKRASSAVSKLFSALDEAKDRTSEQEAINRIERGRRFAAFGSVKDEGALGAAKSLSKLRGQFEKVNPGEGLKLGQEDTDSLFTAVKQANITSGEKARGYTALFKLLNGESNPVRSELKILDDVFGGGFADKIVEMHGGIGMVGLKLSKVVNTMKSLQNAMSLAAPLRHGIGLVARKEFYPAFADMFKFFGNKEYFNAAMNSIENRPNYLLGRDAGLFIAKTDSLANSEEEFLNSYVGKIPVAREVVGASQRGYTGFLNKLRSDTFDAMIKQAKALGHDTSVTLGNETSATDVSKAIARYINNATGRGSLGSLNKMTNELNMLLWSPRMISSRLNMLANPKIYTDLPKGMRLDGLKSLLGIAALGTMVDTLAAYGGAKISTNILSSDYGKSRFGTHVIDPWGGFQQFVVAGARFLAGKTDTTAYPAPSRLDIAGRFAASKESPAASLAHVILTAKKFTGNANDPTTAGDFTTEYGQKTSVQREVAQRFLPIFVQDIEDLAKNEPKWSEEIGLNAILGIASLAGMSQNYPEKRKTSKFKFKKLK